MKIILRPAERSDLNKLNNLQQKLVIYERPFDSGIPKKGIVEYYNLKKLIIDKNSHFIVAQIENQIVGCGFGQIRKNDEWSLNKKLGYIGLIYVDEDFRGQRIAKLIIDELVMWFKKNKISHITLKAYGKNINALNAYRKYGFKDFIVEMKYEPN